VTVDAGAAADVRFGPALARRRRTRLQSSKIVLGAMEIVNGDPSQVVAARH
jgi:hypothetical protein